MKRMFLSLLSILFFIHFVNSQEIDDIKFYTEDYPPFNYMESEELKGLSVDLLMLMLEKLDSKIKREDITVYPWARSYRYVQQKPNTSLFSMQRSTQREDLFKWVGPIIRNTTVLMAKKERNIVINSIEDLKKYKIGVVRDDVGQFILKEVGIYGENIYDITFPWQVVKVLNSGRIDLWVFGEMASYWIIEKNGLNPYDFEKVFEFDTGEALYYAFHIDTPDTIINDFQSALDELKEDGNLKIIIDKYMNNTIGN